MSVDHWLRRSLRSLCVNCDNICVIILLWLRSRWHVNWRLLTVDTSGWVCVWIVVSRLRLLLLLLWVSIVLRSRGHWHLLLLLLLLWQWLIVVCCLIARIHYFIYIYIID